MAQSRVLPPPRATTPSGANSRTKAAPFAAGENIDVLTGATITSKAVIEAVNAACAAPENPDAVPFNLGGDAETEEPAVETILDGSYTLQRPVLFVINRELDAGEKAFVDYIFSDTGRAIVEENGYIPAF